MSREREREREREEGKREEREGEEGGSNLVGASLMCACTCAYKFESR